MKGELTQDIASNLDGHAKRPSRSQFAENSGWWVCHISHINAFGELTNMPLQQVSGRMSCFQFSGPTKKSQGIAMNLVVGFNCQNDGLSLIGKPDRNADQGRRVV